MSGSLHILTSTTTTRDNKSETLEWRMVLKISLSVSQREFDFPS